MSDSQKLAQPLVDRTGANHPMYGRTHTPESLAKMSDSKSGANHPMYGKSPTNAFQSGALNPMYGKSGELSPVSIQVNVYSLDNVLVRSFSSQSSCSKWLGINQYTVSRYIKSGKVWNNKYLFRKSS
jgi:group I intron endonuclease